VVQVLPQGVQVQVQEQVQELEEQELPLQEAQAQEQVAPQQEQAQVLAQGQEVLLLLARVREQVLVLEALVKALAGVMEQAQAEVLDLALGVGLQQVVLEQGQQVLARVQVQAKG
jgi:hypothetical protein